MGPFYIIIYSFNVRFFRITRCHYALASKSSEKDNCLYVGFNSFPLIYNLHGQTPYVCIDFQFLQACTSSQSVGA